MERLDQGHLHPLLKHPETNMYRLGIEPGLPASQASKELFEQLMLLLHGTSTVSIPNRTNLKSFIYRAGMN